MVSVLIVISEGYLGISQGPHFLMSGGNLHGLAKMGIALPKDEKNNSTLVCCPRESLQNENRACHFLTGAILT